MIIKSEYLNAIVFTTTRYLHVAIDLILMGYVVNDSRKTTDICDIYFVLSTFNRT